MTTEQMKDLNGHYCLATKEHYDKLIEDGYHGIWRDRYKFMYIYIEYGWAEFTNVHYTKLTPMHLQNNEWVSGSLKHKTDYIKYGCHCDLEEGKEKDIDNLNIYIYN